MRKSVLSTQSAPKPEQARGLQAQLYREIGITAVAAALRFTTQPEPAQRPSGPNVTAPRPRPDELAA